MTDTIWKIRITGVCGIQRDVYVYARSATHVRDYEVVTDLDGEYKNADFHLFVELGKAGEGKIKGAEVEVSLLEKSGKSIYNERKRGMLPIGNFILKRK